jgi:hypothetical protein
MCFLRHLSTIDRAEGRKTGSSQIGGKESITLIVYCTKATGVGFMESDNIWKKHQCLVHLMVRIDVITVVRPTEPVTVGAQMTGRKTLNLYGNAGPVQQVNGGA